jgi:hypothetical protein
MSKDEDEITNIEEEVDSWSNSDHKDLLGSSDDATKKVVYEEEKLEVENDIGEQENIANIKNSVEVLNDDDEKQLLDYIVEKPAPAPKQVKKELPTQAKPSINKSRISFLVERYNEDEELILSRQEEYFALGKQCEALDPNNISEAKIKELAIDAKESHRKTIGEQITDTMVRSIMKKIDEDDTLEPIASNSFYIQKEQSAFYTDVCRKINSWQEKINNNPHEIINDKYIQKLFSSDFNYKVIKPDPFMYEESFAGDNGLRNFMNTVKQLVSEDQQVIIEQLKVFMTDNNIDNIKLENIFKL